MRDQQPGPAISLQWQRPYVFAAHLATEIDQVLTITGPVGGRRELVLAEQKLFGSASVGGFAAEVGVAGAIGGIGDPFAIRRPKRKLVRNRPERQPGAHSAGQVEHPDVALAVVDF